MFLCGCSDHPNQMFRHKQKSLLVNRCPGLENIFSMGINCMSQCGWRRQEMFGNRGQLFRLFFSCFVSTVANVGFQFGLYNVVAPLTLRSISLASLFAIVYFWLIRSFTDPAFRGSIFVCSPLRGSPTGIFNPAIPTGIFPQSRNPDGFYRLISIPVIFS